MKEIPAVFGVDLTKIEEVLSLGYDINCINAKGNSIIVEYLSNGCSNIKTFEKLISLGANNINHGNVWNALSLAINLLPIYDFGKFLDNFNSETRRLYYAPEEYEKEKKALVKWIIDLSSDDIIMSESVKKIVYKKIEPGFSQIIYNEILEALSKRGFKVEDEYFTESIKFLDKHHYLEYVTNPWGYLWNLYSNFNNKSVETNLKFPKIENAKNYKYGREKSNKLFILIKEHLNRNFITSIEQIEEPDKVVCRNCDFITHKVEEITLLQTKQYELLKEISRYIGSLDYRIIMNLIDNYPMIDNESIIRNEILPIAMEIGDLNLCRELIGRGISIVCYDEDGHDITAKKYSEKQISIYKSLDSEYNPDEEYEDLLAHIGCGQRVRSINQ